MCCGFECEYRPKKGVIVDRPHHNLKDACITGFNGNGDQVTLVKYIPSQCSATEACGCRSEKKNIGATGRRI
jgi:hypothetical protein